MTLMMHELMDKYEAGINNKLKTLMKLFLYIRKMNKFMKSARLIIEKWKRDVLANRHQFGDAASPLEKELNHLSQNLNSMKNLKKKNYVQAHNHIMGLNESMNEVKSIWMKFRTN